MKIEIYQKREIELPNPSFFRNAESSSNQCVMVKDSRCLMTTIGDTYEGSSEILLSYVVNYTEISESEYFTALASNIEAKHQASLKLAAKWGMESLMIDDTQNPES